MMHFRDLPPDEQKRIERDYKKACAKARAWVAARMKLPMGDNTPYKGMEERP